MGGTGSFSTRILLAKTAGLVLILTGLACNPWLLGALVSPDGVIESLKLRGLIILFELMLVVPGLMLVGVVKPPRWMTVFTPSWPNILATLFGTGVAFILLVFVELFCLVLDRMEQGVSDELGRDVAQAGEYSLPDPLLGYRPKAGVSVRNRRVHGDDLAYDVTYTFDECHRRVTPVAEGASPSRFALFFGGSYTFGEGVEAQDTFPAQFALAAPDYRSYNYAFSGYGPQQMLARLQETAIETEVAEQEGIAVYVFISDHINRAIGSMDITNGWGSNFPYYTVEDDRLVHRGTFSTGRRFTTLSYRLLGKSHLIKRLHFTLPAWRKSHFELAAQLMEESRKSFENKFTSRGFFVVMYPDRYEGASFEPYLRASGVTVLDYTDLISLDDPQYYIRHDKHPNGKAHAVVAQRLAADLKSVE